MSVLRTALLLLLLCFVALRSQERDSAVSVTRLSIVGGATIGGFVVGHAVLNDLWWKGSRTDFHINTDQDYRYALNADKLGHATFAYIATTTYADLFRWTGMDSAQAVWSAAGVATAYQTYIEVRDGFSEKYGFSWGDIAANMVGISLPVLKHYYPSLRPFDLQVSFWPSQDFRNGYYNAIIDDYTSTTHWLSVNIHDLAPTSTFKDVPAWLGLAIGHSVQNLDGMGGGQHRVFVSLDWNLSRIEGLPPWLRDIMRTLHLYHLPAPAVQISPNVVWYGIRF